jgi:hypothetical protein
MYNLRTQQLPDDDDDDDEGKYKLFHNNNYLRTQQL